MRYESKEFKEWIQLSDFVCYKMQKVPETIKDYFSYQAIWHHSLIIEDSKWTLKLLYPDATRNRKW